MFVKWMGEGEAEIGILDFLDPELFDLHVIQITNSVDDVLIGLQSLRWGTVQGHRNVDVFEDVARGDAEHSLIGLDQIVTLASAMLASELVGEAESGSELFCLDEETGAVCLPFLRFHAA